MKKRRVFGAPLRAAEEPLVTIQEAAMMAVAVLALVFFPWVLDLYDLPKRACLHVLTLGLLAVHALLSTREAGGVVLSAGPLGRPMVAYALCMALASLKAINPYDALDGFLQQALPMVLAVVLISRGLSARACERFITVAISAGVVAAVVGLMQYCKVDTDAWGIRQVVGPASLFGNKNMAAEYVLAIMPLALYRWNRRGWSSLYPWLTVAILAFLFATRTKAVWVGALVVLAVALFRQVRLMARGKNPWQVMERKAAMLAGVFALFVALVYLPTVLRVQQDTGLAALNSAVKSTGWSASVRFALWANSLPMLACDPLLGVGPNNWYIHYPRYAMSVLRDPTFSTTAQAEHPHNDLVQIVGEAGVLGGLACLWILWTLGRLALSQEPAPDDDSDDTTARNFFVSLSMLAILIDGCFAYPLHLAPGAGLFWIGAAILVSTTPGLTLKPVILPGGAGAAVVVVVLALAVGAREIRIVEANRYYRHAAIAMASNKNAEAIQHLQQSISFDGHRYRTHSVLGRALIGLNRLEESIAEYKLALECHPNQINVMYNLAQALHAAGKAEESLQYLERAVDVVPTFVEGLYLKGSYLKEKGDRAGALKTFEQLSIASPEHADAFNEMGNIQKDLKQFEAAERSYRRAVQLKPEYGEVYNNLGVVFLEQAQHAKAVPEFEKAIRFSPDYPGTYFNAGRSYAALGRNAEALRAFRSFAERWKGDASTRSAAEAEIKRLEALVQTTPAATSPQR
jgi:tetratricopeptide (TPR) repeat protein